MRTTIAAARPAFTLLEVLVAIVLLGGGVLAVASGATSVMQALGDGARHSLAASVAVARLEHLSSQPCHSIAHGSAVTRSIHERWTASPLGTHGRAVEIAVTVQYRTRLRATSGAARAFTIRGAVPCD